MSVEAALDALLAGVDTLATEQVALDGADRRWLAEPVIADRDQPPFDVSAMDGWAVRSADLGGGALRVVGESAAGRSQPRAIGSGETVRIFTGAPIPPGADRVVPQEDARPDGDQVTLVADPQASPWVRPRGGDYRQGDVLVSPPSRLGPESIALAASAGHAFVVCARRPRVVVLAGGDELVAAGRPVGDHQIRDAAGPGVAAIARRAGADVLRPPLVGDTAEEIGAALAQADADLIVTIGGASVGDHDRVKPAARSLGAVLEVDGVAMRPGKPLWAASLPDGRRILGLPGNPVSALVCARLFLVPLLAALQGGHHRPVWRWMPLAEHVPANGLREHYMRAIIETDRVRVLPDQDSSRVTVLTQADALVRRRPNTPASSAGEAVEVLARET